MRRLFLFRRDLRVTDNTGLLAALQQSEPVIAAFILDPRQVDPHPYRSERAFHFLLQSLHELAQELRQAEGRLYLFHGPPAQVLEQLIREDGVGAVHVNRDFTPFSRARDAELQARCAEHGVTWQAHDDLLLHPPEHTLKSDGMPYTVFTPFYKNACKLAVPPVNASRPTSGLFLREPTRTAQTRGVELEALLSQASGESMLRGGRSEALGVLQAAANFRGYETQRDQLGNPSTTRLSAHHKFGTISPRESYSAFSKALGADHGLVRQLYWRDFFTQIAWHFPHVFGQAFQKRFSEVAWTNDLDCFSAWCEGRTGFPIVDAGMRELNETGFMHNRARMIVASFLTKDLHIDWRWGERYFAQKLVDYDPCVNNGSWQWAASTGCDAQPYFRIFNPWLQQKRFDPDAAYIHRWVPELRALAPRQLHELDKSPQRLLGYPAPIVQHGLASQQAKALFAGLAA